MRTRQTFERSLIERFSLSRNADGEPAPGDLEHDPGAERHYRRFLKLVTARKQQMLEKILMDED